MSAGQPILPLNDVRGRLVKRFRALANDLPSYAARVSSECARFPIGTMFPFAVPAMALDVAKDAGAAERDAAERLLGGAIASLERQHRKPALEIRTADAKCIGFGWCLLALAVHERSGGSARFAEVRRHLSSVMNSDLRAREFGPLDSYSGRCWPFDTVPGVLGLHLSAALDGHSDWAETVAGHVRWIRGRGRDARLDLPVSFVSAAKRSASAPRGCDLSLRQGLTELLDPDLAREHWREYTRHFWQEQLWAGGFREYPRGASGQSDIDSGAILAGMGFVATAFGLGAAACAGDSGRTARLAGMFRMTSALVGAGKLAMHLPPLRTLPPRYRRMFDAKAETGFLFGDVCLLHSLSWPAFVRAERMR